MTIKATYYGANGWLIELDKTRILIDPWLNGDLTFPPGDWLIKGKLGKEIEVPKDVDLLLLKFVFCTPLFDVRKKLVIIVFFLLIADKAVILMFIGILYF